MSVCICEALPPEQLTLQTKLLVVQHALERHRKVIGTVPLLEACLTNFERVTVDPRGRLLGSSETGDQAPIWTAADLAARCHDGACLLLYPCAQAVEVESLVLDAEPSGTTLQHSSPPCSNTERTLIVIDGTWPQARQIFEFLGFSDAVRAGTLRCIQVAPL
jgi:DTW domain-containing protein YfiP